MSGAVSYKEILRNSSIMGGAHGLNYIVALVRIKVIALLLGPAGLGFIGLYSSTLSLISAISNLGIGTSGVREVAQSHSLGDPREAARVVQTLRRVCWFTGLVGWALTAALANFISRWVFGSTDHATAIAILGMAVLFGAVTSGQVVLLQGVRRIGDLARINVTSALVNSLTAIGIYAWLRERGIVPVILVTALVSLALSWWFARRVQVEPVELNWADTYAGARRLVVLGVAVMWSGFLTAALDLATRSLIVREYGVDASGIFQAAWSVSGAFAGFILSAMGTDFFPRLSSAIGDYEHASRIVNEQTEVGVLLALPGLLGTMAFAPAVMEIFFSARFTSGADLLPWLLLGVFGRVVSWPLGYILLAMGSSRWYVVTESTFFVVNVGLVFGLVPAVGVRGAAYAFAITYLVVTIAMLRIAFLRIGFKWSREVRLVLLTSGALITVCGASTTFIPGLLGAAGGGLIAVVGALFCVRGLVNRLGSSSRLAAVVYRLPGGARLVRSIDRKGR